MRGRRVEQDHRGEHAGRDADRGRDHRRADEQRLNSARAPRAHLQTAASEWYDDAEYGDRGRPPAHPEDGRGLRLKSDGEEEEDDAEFGQRVHQFGGCDPVQQTRPDYDAREDFARHGRLPQALERLSSLAETSIIEEREQEVRDLGGRRTDGVGPSHTVRRSSVRGCNRGARRRLQ